MEKVLHRAKAINGWMSDAELSFLAELASKSKRILEVGSYKGRSTRALADNTSGKVICVDPWDGCFQVYRGNVHYNGDNTTFSEFYCYLNDHIKSGKVSYKRDLFQNLSFDEPFDLIFIDALHFYEDVKRDTLHALKFIDKGILAGHDYSPNYWEGVEKAVKEIFGEVKVKDTIWWVELK